MNVVSNILRVPKISTSSKESMAYPALSLLESVGYVHIADFPKEEVFEYLSSIGKISAQPDGKLCYHVQFEPGYDNFYFTKSANSIGPHTEEPYRDKPPRYLALYCVEPAQCGGGKMRLFSPFPDIMTELTPTEIELLNTVKIPFSSNKYSTTRNLFKQTHAEYPLLQINKVGKKILRYSHNLLFHGDINAKVTGNDKVLSGLNGTVQRIIQNINTCYFQQGMEFLLPKSSLLIWDNHRFLHGRTEFSDIKRHLIRFYLND